MSNAKNESTKKPVGNTALTSKYETMMIITDLMTKLKTISKIQHVHVKDKLQPETDVMSCVNYTQERKKRKERHTINLKNVL